MMVESGPGSVSAAGGRLLGSDPELRARRVEGGRRTVADDAWERRIDRLEQFLEQVARQTGSPVRQADPA